MDNTEKALQILKAAEIKESDFKSESIYNTILGNIIMLLLEQDKMKEALFQRNQIIQDLDQEIQELDKDIEELNDKIESLEHDVHLTEEQVRHKKMDIELLKDRVNVLEKILLPHQELTQWVEEEIDNMDKNELLNFIQKLYDKVYKLNHD